MSKATTTIEDKRTWCKTKGDLSFLSDRLFSAGITALALKDSARLRQDLIDASRALVRLVAMYEAAAQRELVELKLGGMV